VSSNTRRTITKWHN